MRLKTGTLVEAYRTFVAFILGRNGKLTVIAQRRFQIG
jgi:hypothetical protein